MLIINARFALFAKFLMSKCECFSVALFLSVKHAGKHWIECFFVSKWLRWEDLAELQHIDIQTSYSWSRFLNSQSYALIYAHINVCLLNIFLLHNLTCLTYVCSNVLVHVWLYIWLTYVILCVFTAERVECRSCRKQSRKKQKKRSFIFLKKICA